MTFSSRTVLARKEIMNSTKIKLCLRLMVFCVAAWLFAAACSNCQSQVRTWTDSSGTYELEAELVDVTESDDGLLAEMLMSDGRRMGILISKLCKADQLAAETFFSELLKKAAEPVLEIAEPAKAIAEPASVVIKETPIMSQNSRMRPEERITSRPIGAPVSMASGKLDNRNVTTVNFDPASAIRLEREIPRDEKGKPTENPVYKVEVLERQLDFLPQHVRRIVIQLNDPSVAVDVKRRSIELLQKNWPQGRHPGLLNVLINMLSDDDKYLRLASIDLLANHDSDQSLIYIFARIDDVSFDVRWRTYEILTQLRDPRIIPELCERLGGSDRTKIASVLQAFGATSTPWVLPWLESDKDEEVLLNVCQLLGKIGGTDSLEALEKLVDHKSFLVRAQTENSIKQIRQRLAKPASNLPTRR